MRVEPGGGPDEQRLTIARAGVVLLERRAASFDLAPLRVGESLGKVAPGSDLDGDGTPDLAVVEWTGGVHASHRVRVYRLGATLRPLGSARTADPGVAAFERPTAGGPWTLRTHDWTFAGWRAAFACSPAPEVALRFGPHGPRLAWERMRRPLPAAEEAATALRADPAWARGEVPPGLWDAMLEALYAGDAPRAWSLLATAWPPGRPGQDAFRAAFLAQLAQSPYWPELSARLGL
ncbi:MAG: hypothetical protein D6731_00860 [Planctomycetota bacterium]|nr:MAG: hypothetical protein D6731_00860 [Planctomycetota bacterium]